MEFILQETDIFDEDIGRKFNEVIINNKDVFKSECDFKITVSFHVNLLTDERFQQFNIGDSGKRRGRTNTNKDKMYDVLSFQLDKVEQAAIENGIKVYSFKIQGDLLEAENLIKIEIVEDTSDSITSGRRKGKISEIIPNLRYTRELVTELVSTPI
ncbi:hypothetical protein [Brevibacillus centrosporus]|uniref:hypothetical protein n=1 Tax=Brevibacillus centrosporus TaxID=54910 RepID=UPI002E1E500A|nr:hypothetical protein [Brevibacillus centrosporus]